MKRGLEPLRGSMSSRPQIIIAPDPNPVRGPRRFVRHLTKEPSVCLIIAADRAGGHKSCRDPFSSEFDFRE